MILQENEHIITENADEKTVIEVIDNADSGYIILSDEATKSYIQTMIESGGYTGIVEARIYDDDKNFRHYGAEISCGDPARDNIHAVVGGISVVKKRVIEKSSIKKIFVYFLDHKDIDPKYTWNEFPEDYFE